MHFYANTGKHDLYHSLLPILVSVRNTKCFLENYYSFNFEHEFDTNLSYSKIRRYFAPVP